MSAQLQSNLPELEALARANEELRSHIGKPAARPWVPSPLVLWTAGILLRLYALLTGLGGAFLIVQAVCLGPDFITPIRSFNIGRGWQPVHGWLAIVTVAVAVIVIWWSALVILALGHALYVLGNLANRGASRW